MVLDSVCGGLTCAHGCNAEKRLLQGYTGSKRKRARKQGVGKEFFQVSIGKTFQVLFEPWMDGVALTSRSMFLMG